MSVSDRTREYSAPPEDVEAVTHATQEYFESWYTADPERMRKCLHPDLAKRTLKHDQKMETWVLHHIDGRTMVELAGKGGGNSLPVEQRWLNITVLDVARSIASTKFTSHEYVEHVHLARFDRGWLIVNTLWEPRSK